jgi:DNA polymerase-3 subunit alpha
MKYINLHAHTHYSPMDGYSTVDEYMLRLKEIGADAMAITDHGTLAGHRDFQRATKENGVKPILGVEAYLSPTDRFDRRAKANREDADSVYNHLILLAKSDKGLRNIQAGNRVAWNEGFYQKPRWDFELLKEYSEDVIVLSGCLNGVIAKALGRHDDAAAEEWAIKFKEVFGDDFYLEYQTHNPSLINAGQHNIGLKLGIKGVLTDDCHHASPKDKLMQEVFLILSTHPKMDKTADINKAQKMDLMERFDYLYPERKMSFKDFDLYLEGYKEKYAKYPQQDLFDNTVEITNKVEEYTYYEGLTTLPNIAEDPNETLRINVQKGLKRRGMDQNPEAQARVERELGVITGKGFSNYFLVVEDMLNWARKQKIRLGKGRGSAAASLVGYSLYITDVDPLEHNLMFERFLDPERADYPDVDIDIQDTRRDEVRKYLVERYGHVANITNINTYKGKKALKDAARVIGVPYAEVNKTMKILEGIDEVTGHDVIAEFKKSPMAKAFNTKYPDVVNIAEKLFGRINGYGMHAAGIVIANKPIAEYAPIETRKSTGSDDRVEVVALDKDECEKLGLIKMDLLGLKTLSVIDDAIKLIGKNRGVIVDIDSLSTDDPRVFKTLATGKTLGVFQCEAAPYTKLLVKMGCEDFNDLVVSNALIRPGAWNAIGEDYIAFKRGQKKPRKLHDDVESYMQETFYQPIYQEQMMRLSVDLAGFTVGESNKLRKGIGKKKREVVDSFKVQFLEGAQNKIAQSVAEKLWKSFEEAGAYAFVKTHAVCYSILSYQTAWLKVHYPQEFMCALLQNESNNEAITDYLLECKNMGIKIKFPHINKSERVFSVEEEALRMGLVGVKYISDKVADRIIAGRPYADYAQFKQHVLTKGSGLNTRVLQALNAFGGAAFEDNPRPENYKDNLYEYLGIPAFDSKLITNRMKQEMRALEDYSDDETFFAMAMVKNVKRGEGWARVDMLDGTASAGAFTEQNTEIAKGQMYIFLISNNRIVKAISLAGELNESEEVILDYLRRPTLDDIPEGMHKVLAARKWVSKAGNNTANLVVCDKEKNLFSLMCYAKNFDKVRLFARLGSVRKFMVSRKKDGAVVIEDIS